jgi:flagellar protein FlgJ
MVASKKGSKGSKKAVAKKGRATKSAVKSAGRKAAGKRRAGVGAAGAAKGAARVASVVTFPSGESLRIVSAPSRPGQEHYDPNNSGNPLLDTGGANRNKKLSNNFTAGELAKSGEMVFNIARIDTALVAALQAIRDHVGKPVTVTSGYRSFKYNTEIYRRRGRRPTLSQHISGRGADIKIEGMSGVQIAKAAIDAAGCKVAVGLGATFAHVDVRGRFAVWNYGGVTQRQIDEVARYHRSKCGG